MIKLLNRSKGKTIKQKDEKLVAVQKYYQENPLQEILYDYELGENSTVFDLGGYIGEYSEKIYSRYSSLIYIFEPYPRFFAIIENKFRYNKKILPFNLGLSNDNFVTHIKNEGTATSIKNSNPGIGEKVQVRNISEFITENNIGHIDLMKINVEGSEYEILPELIKSNLIHKITNLLVQFHEINDNSKADRASIQSALQKSHKKTFDYEFIWESWTLRSEL